MKIHIIGGTGSGKTYFGKKLAARYNLPLLDLDTIFWDASSNRYGVKNTKEKRLQELSAFMKNESYIIEGIYYSWLEDAFERADKIVILDVALSVRIYRMVKRFIRRKLGFEQGKKETLRDLLSLIRWSFKHLKEDMPKILAIKERYPHKSIICKNVQMVDVFCKKMLAK